MGYQDFTDGNALPASQLDEASKQGVLKYASAAARDADATLTAALREGMVFYLDNTNTLQVQISGTSGAVSTVATVHGALPSFTPAVTQNNAVAVTVNYCSFQKLGRWYMYTGLLAVTGTGTASNGITVQLPATANSAGSRVVGSGRIYDASAATFFGTLAVLPGTTALGLVDGTGTLLGASTSTFTAGLASGDLISWTIMYEASADV